MKWNFEIKEDFDAAGITQADITDNRKTFWLRDDVCYWKVGQREPQETRISLA